LRGRLKRHNLHEDIAVIGDHVWLTDLGDGTGAIERVEPRQRALVRRSVAPKGEFRQILVANLDQIVMVFACRKPTPHLRMLDRFLVIAEKQGIPALIVANKLDLTDRAEAESLFAHYRPLGYPVCLVSARLGLGMEELHQQLVGKVSALTGPSGVGKTSLLNTIQPGLGLQVREVSDVTAKGRHTTVVSELFPLQGGGYVADMPGIRALALWDIFPEELDGYFPELRELIKNCQFNDCTHQNETDCAVIKAVASGQVHPQRYQSYLRMRFGAPEVEEIDE
jgi:ribosome biogenesis GTPase